MDLIQQQKNLLSQVQAQRSQIGEQRAGIIEAQSKASAMRQQAIDPGQKALRDSQGISALKGRQVAQFKTGQQQKAITEIATGFETAAKPIEQELKQVESQTQSNISELEAQDYVMKSYYKGKLWAVAAYGTGRERQLAKQMIKDGYASTSTQLEEQGKAEAASRAQLQSTAKELGISTQQLIKGFTYDKTGNVTGYSGPLPGGGKSINFSNAVIETKPLPSLEVKGTQPKLYSGAIPTSVKGATTTTVSTQAIPAVRTGPITNFIRNLGTGTEAVLSKVPAFTKGENFNYTTSLPYQVKSTSFMTPEGVYYAPGKNIQYTGPTVAKLGGQAAMAAPFFIPYVGEALAVGMGVETAVEAPTWQGKLLGAGGAILGAYSGYSRFKSLKQIKDIAGAQTTFVAKEAADAAVPEASIINTVSKTKIGKDTYFGAEKQVVFEKNLPELGNVRIGSSEGIRIKGNGRVYPIDVVTDRIVPTREVFVTKVVGSGKKVISSPMGKVSVEAGDGVVGVARIKPFQSPGFKESFVKGTQELKGQKPLDPITSNVAGAFKPVEGVEGSFTFLGGDAPRQVLTKEGIVARVKPNIRGVVTQTADNSIDFIGGNKGDIITIQKGKQILDPVTQQMVTESVAAQRAGAIDIALTKSAKTEMGRMISSSASRIGNVGDVETTATTMTFAPKVETVTDTTVIQTQQPKSQVLNITTPRTEQASSLTPRTDVRIDTLLRVEPRQAPMTAQAMRVQQNSRMDLRSNVALQAKVTNKKFVTAFDEDTDKRKRLFDTLGKSKLYKVLSKRRGKWFEVGKGLSKSQAEFEGFKYTQKTLARSFKIEESGYGQAKEINFRVPGRLYRSPVAGSKLPSGTYVQIKALSRGTGEVQEILRSKRSKPNKGRKFKWL